MRITIGNSVSKIEGLTIKQFKELREILSYSPDPKAAYFGGGHRGSRRYLLSKRGDFPTGLLYLVRRYFKGQKVQWVDTRIRPRTRQDAPGSLFIEGMRPTPYPEQMAAAKAAVTACRGIISAVTALGKSLIAALIFDELKVPTLIVVPSLELKRQLTETMTLWFGAEIVGGFLRIENVDALPMEPMKGYDCVIIDEFHHSAAKTYRKLNVKAWGGIFYRFGLTATPFRSQDHERLLLESVLSKIVYRITYQEAVKNKRIVPIEAYYIDLPAQEIQGNESSWQAMTAELVTNNRARNKIIEDLLVDLCYANIPTLCLVKEVYHALQLAERACVAAVVGVDPLSRDNIGRFNSGEIISLVGTSGMIGEGVDTKRAEYLLDSVGGTSKTAFMQRIGRLLRLSPGKESGKLIMFRDTSHPWFIKHFKAQCKVLREEYGVKPVKLR